MHNFYTEQNAELGVFKCTVCNVCPQIRTKPTRLHHSKNIYILFHQLLLQLTECFNNTFYECIKNVSFRHNYFELYCIVLNMLKIFATGRFTTSYQTSQILFENHCLLKQLFEARYPCIELSVALPCNSFVRLS